MREFTFFAENSSATVNGTSDVKHFTTEGTKELDESPSNQNNCNEQQNQANGLKEPVSIYFEQNLLICYGCIGKCYQCH